MEEYKNTDGTYTSPKNGKTYKSLKALIAHLSVKPGTGTWSSVNNSFKNCKFCNEKKNLPNIKKHEISCYLNPTNVRPCIICGNPIKNYKSSKGTCSKSCANTHFKSGVNNGNWKGERYTTVCFLHHNKKCVVCGEDKIVAVHHFNEDHNDNTPENLIPLCPTHHSYMHSRYKGEILHIVEEYIKQFVNSINRL